MVRFQDKVAIVTGGGSGIGRATATMLHAGGARVVVADRSGAECAVAEELGEGAVAVSVDVTNSDAVANMVAVALAEFGRVDVLCCCAGISTASASFLELDMADVRLSIDVNLIGPILCMKHTIPAMLETGGGSVVNIASGAAIRPVPGLTAYGASKAGLLHVSKIAALDLARQNIRINAVCPGITDTALWAGMVGTSSDIAPLVNSIPMGRIAQPEEIATTMAFLASEDASYITGAVFAVDGGRGAM